MGFVRSLITGKPNRFSASPASLSESSYADAIRQAQANALAVNPQQQALADALRAATEGRGPSVAENQLNQATDRNIQQTSGLIGSQRGLSPALAARIAAKMGADASQGAAGQAATLRAQEQISARGQLADVLGGMQAGSTNLAGTTGQLQGQQNTARIQNTLGTNQINAGVARDNADFQAKIIGGLISGGGAALGKPAGGSDGGEVPGEPRVMRDDPRNDTVPALLTPDEIVLPLSITKAPDAPDRAAEFVRALQAKKGEGGGYGQVLAQTRELEARLARLEHMAEGGEVKPTAKKTKPPPDADLGPKRDADVPAYQLPVYRGETARQPGLVGKLARVRMADGGEVDPSILDALKKWWAKEGDKQPEGKQVADAVNAKLPRAVSGRVLVEANQRKQRAIDEALAAGN